VPAPAWRVAELAGLGAGERDQLRQGLCRHLVRHDEDIRRDEHRAIGAKILDRIEGELVDHARAEDERPVGDHARVVPSGAALATRDAAMLPPAPVTFSTRPACPRLR